MRTNQKNKRTHGDDTRMNRTTSEKLTSADITMLMRAIRKRYDVLAEATSSNTDNTDNIATENDQQTEVHISEMVNDAIDGAEHEQETLNADAVNNNNEEVRVNNESCNESQSSMLSGRLSRTRYAISDITSTFSLVAGISTWILLIAYAASSARPSLGWLMPYASIADAAAFALAISLDEISCKLDGWGRGALGTLMIIASIAGLAVTVNGNQIGSADMIAAGIFSLFALSFVPMILDRWGIGTRKRMNAYKQAKQAHENRTIANGGGYYDPLADALGIPQPRPLPPIEITRDDIPDDEWRDILGITNTNSDKHLIIDSTGVDTAQELAERILADKRNEKLNDEENNPENQ